MRRFWLPVALLLAWLALVQVWTAAGESQTWDEGIHLASGYAYWAAGDYSWNPEHPPLVKLMSALPLLALRPELPLARESWRTHNQVAMGRDFLYRNRVGADTLLMAGRLPAMLLTALGGLLLALWTRRRFGVAAALFALAFYAFDPNFIAHGRYVTTDMPMAVFFFLTCALWTEYLITARVRDLAMAALAFALALVVKFSAVLLIPVVAALYAVRWWQRPGEFGWRRAATALAVLVAAGVLSVGTVYGRETWRSFDEERPWLRDVVDRGNFTGRMLYRFGKWFDLPAHPYLTGLDAVARHNHDGHQAYLLGQVRDKGVWYYFPVVAAVKSTLAALAAFLLLAGVALWRVLRGRWRGAIGRVRNWPIEWIAMTAPPLFWFAVAMSSGINLGVRHILPVYPPLYVATGALLAALAWRKALRYGAFALVAVQAAECASIHPHYLAFFNAASGGPEAGPRYLLDSNIDWGQDMKKLSVWLRAHGTRRVWFSYFGAAEAPYYGIEELNLPRPDEIALWNELDGYAAVSITQLKGVYGNAEDFARLRNFPVAAKVGYSIYVFDLRKKR